MDNHSKRELVNQAIEKGNGILRVSPAWVASTPGSPIKRNTTCCCLTWWIGTATASSSTRAYLQVAGEGFHLPAGYLYAPGTALTLELQEDSDVFAHLQALVGGKIISKELLFKGVSPEDRAKYGEAAVLKQIDWDGCGDPYFYENHHLEALPVQAPAQDGGRESWIYYNTAKFSGKRLVVKPGKTFTSLDHGVYNILAWQGLGRYDGHAIEAGNFGLDTCFDELLITYEKAVSPIKVENTGAGDLVIFKFFGPDINPNVPHIPVYKLPGIQ